MIPRVADRPSTEASSSSAPRHVGYRAGRDGYRNPSLREGDRAGVGPAAPEADPPGGLDRLRRAVARRRRHPLRLTVARLPSGGVNKQVWLWWSGAAATTANVDRCWQSFLRRFDLEHTFRLFKQTLGWTKPRLRNSEADDRWTRLVIATYAQLRLARPLASDLRRPWEKPALPNKLTPARVRRGFRNLCTKTGSLASAPKPSRPGPGKPTGSKNRRPAPRHDVGRVLATGEAYSRPDHHKTGTKPRGTVTELPRSDV